MRSTVVQYSLLSVLGVISNPSHIIVPHRIFGRISNDSYRSSAPQVYTASLLRPLQPIKPPSVLCQLHKLQEELVRNAEMSAKLSVIYRVALFQLWFPKHYRPRCRGEIRSWVDLPSTLDAGGIAILSFLSLHRLFVL